MNGSDSIRDRLPILTWARQYRFGWLRGDLLAGLVVAALAVPQALGYATIAGVPVVLGIYAIPAALVAYALFGSSPHLVVGPVSTVSVVSGTLVLSLSGGDPDRAIVLTTALAIASGLGLLVGGLLRIGWAAEFLSRPIVTGFVFGLVLVIIIGEIPKLLGLPAVSGDSIEQAVQILGNITQLHGPTAAIGLGALAILVLGARFASALPWGLMVLVAAIALSSAFSLPARDVVVIGPVPSGLPPIGLPDINPSDVAPVLFGGLAMAMVGLAEGLSAARMFAAREGYSIDSNQELLGSGVANVAAGLSGGLGVAGSLSKTAASRRAGGKTQVTGLTAAAVTLLVLVLFAGALEPLPRTVLSAIVIQAVWGLMDLSAFRRYQRIRRNDFVAAIAALVGVVIFGPLYGLLIAIGLALLGLVYRSSRLDVEVMGKVPEEKAAWGSLRNHPERRTYPGVVVVRLDAPLFWANASEAADLVLRRVDESEGAVALVLDLEATSQLDTTSVDALGRMLDQLDERAVDLYLVRVFYQPRRTLARAEFLQRLGEDHMWHSISAGVRAARRAADLSGRARAQIEAEVEESGVDAEADLPAGSERIAVEDGVEDDGAGDAGAGVDGSSGNGAPKPRGGGSPAFPDMPTAGPDQDRDTPPHGAGETAQAGEARIAPRGTPRRAQAAPGSDGNTGAREAGAAVDVGAGDADVAGPAPHYADPTPEGATLSGLHRWIRRLRRKG